MYGFMITITVDEGLRSAVANGGEPLRDLCRKEVDNFDQYLRKFGEDYRDGLSKFERLAIEGYIYQKLRGRVDNPTSSPTDLPG